MSIRIIWSVTLAPIVDLSQLRRYSYVQRYLNSPLHAVGLSSTPATSIQEKAGAMFKSSVLLLRVQNCFKTWRGAVSALSTPSLFREKQKTLTWGKMERWRIHSPRVHDALFARATHRPGLVLILLRLFHLATVPGKTRALLFWCSVKRENKTKT